MQTQELLNRPRDVELRFAQFPAPTQVFDLILSVCYCKIFMVEKLNIYHLVVVLRTTRFNIKATLTQGGTYDKDFVAI